MLVFFVIVLAFVAGMGIYFSKVEYNAFDFYILSNIRKLIYPSMFFVLLTKLGDTSTYFILLAPVAIYLIYKRNYKLLFTLFFAVLAATISMKIFKHIFQRERPFEFFVYMQGGFSYPSGHSTVSAALYWTLAKLCVINKKSKFVTAIFIVIPFLIGLSRLVLGVHWPTDVLIGLLLGFSISLLSVEIYKNFGELNNE